MRKKMIVWVIDIGNYSTKLIKASRHMDGVVEITDSLMTTKWTRQEMLADKKSPLPTCVTTFFQSYKRRDQVTLLIGDCDLRIDFWRLPFVKEDEIEAMIYWKMQELSGGRLKDWHYDYLAREQVESYKNLGIEEYSIEALSVGVSKEMILNYSRCFKKCRRIYLNPIQPQFYGIGKSLKEEEEQIFFLDLGHFKSIFYDFKNTMLVDKMEMLIEDKQTLREYLKMIRRSIEDHIQLDYYRNKGKKPLLFLIGGGSLGSGIQAFLGGSDKYRLGSLVDLLGKYDNLQGLGEMKKDQVSLFFPAIAAVIGE